MTKKFSLSLSLLIGLASCTTNVQTNPARTATEELLLSSASDRAAAKLALTIPSDSRVFLDGNNFEGTDSKYALASVRSHLLQRGLSMVDDKKIADVIVEARAGALSTDRKSYLIGIPGFNVPIPLTSGTLPFPEIALYGKEEQNGVAKFAVTGYDAKSGRLIDAQEPQLGFSHNTKKTILLFFSSAQADFLPQGLENEEDANEAGKTSHLGINGNGYSSIKDNNASSSTDASASTNTSSSAPSNNNASAPFKIPGIGR